jgi:TAT (twin-arginine translocation) pathway-exported protein
MNDIRLSRRQLLKGAGAVGVLGAIGIPTTVFADGTKIKWNVITIDRSKLPTSATVTAGGMLSAQAENNFKITITGAGTFRTGEDGGVTGGGTWTTSGPTGTQSGTYKVTRFVSWEVGPGILPAKFIDLVGNHADERGGLAVLRIRYSDGSQGVLTVSCNLDGAASAAVFEGITATKGFVDYFQPVMSEEPPPAPATATLFHVISEDSGD